MEGQNDYYVNLKQEEFSQVFQNINKVFEGNYLTYITEIKKSHPLFVDIMIILRKYQYFLQKICLNNSILCCFDKKDFLNKLNTLESILFDSQEYFFSFYIHLLPKFKTNELKFILPENLLKLKIDLTLLWKKESFFEVKKAEVESLNLSSVFPQEKFDQLNKLLSKILTLILDDYMFLPFQGLNVFLNHIENYFPQLFQNENNLQKEEEDHPWNQIEQNKLEELIAKYKQIDNLKDKMKKIANEMKSKSLKQITLRYKELVLEYSKKKKQNKEYNECEISNENKKEEELKSKVNLQLRKNIENDEKSKKENQVTKTKLFDNNKSVKLITTDDILNEIIKVYQEKYANHDLNDTNISNKSSILFDNTSQKNTENSTLQNKFTDDEEEELEEDEDEDSTLKDKNNELLDIYLSTTLQPTLTPEELCQLKTILIFGDKFQINLDSLQMINIGLAKIIAIKLLLKCSNCKKVAFESNYQKIDKQENILYMGARCPRCENEMFSIFKYQYLHEQNKTIAGITYAIGCFIVDFLPSTFALSCLNCEEIKKIKLRSGNLHCKDSKCTKCFTILGFNIQSVNITPTYETELNFLEQCQIINFSKYNHVIKDDIDLDNYAKRIFRIIQDGKPLPLYGTCLHYKKSFRWFRFSCCHKIFPCDECHNEASEHTVEIAKTILCGFCAFEQTASNKQCAKCGSLLIKTEAGNAFWEGGKGCRNKAFMSSKDSHKYTGSKLKTISKKKREKLISNPK